MSVIAVSTFTITVFTELEPKPDGVTAHIKDPTIMGNTAFIGAGITEAWSNKLHEMIKYAIFTRIGSKMVEPPDYNPRDTPPDPSNIKVN